MLVKKGLVTRKIRKKERTDSEDRDRNRKKERMLTWRKEKDRTGTENVDTQGMPGENGDREKREG